MLALKMREMVEKTGASELCGEGKSCSKTPWGWGVLARRKSTGSSRAPGSSPHRPHGAQKGL